MLTLHSLRLRLLLAMVGIPVIALIAVGVAMHYTNESRLNDSLKFRVIRQPTGRGTGLRESGDEARDQPSGETALTLWPNTQPILFASDLGQGYLIQAAPGFVAAYEQDQQADISALNQRLTIAVGGVCLIAAGAAFGVSRRVVGPVESLTAAARQLEAGDLKRRVAIRSKDEVGELGHAFNAMAESLERNEALRKTITSDIAHELRTPLNNISGYLDAVADGVVAPDQAVIASLQEEAGLLVRLVNDLEQLSLADAGHQTLLHEPVEVERLVARAVAMVGARAATKGVRFVSEAPGQPLWVSGDPARLGQVVRNLLENAVTHTPEGGTVTVAISGSIEVVRLRVTDSGPGIPEEHLPYIFERFYRADPSRARNTGGAGLGLAIVKQLVDAHRGTVEAANAAGAGAEFTVMLPALAQAEWRARGLGTVAPGIERSSF